MNRIEEPEAEVSRLKSVVEWQRATIEQRDERIAELIGERDSLMDQCHGLQRLADERDGLRMRAATLEKHLSGVVNMITDDGQTFTANFNEEFRGRIRDSWKYLKTEKARARRRDTGGRKGGL